MREQIQEILDNITVTIEFKVGSPSIGHVGTKTATDKILALFTVELEWLKETGPQDCEANPKKLDKDLFLMRVQSNESNTQWRAGIDSLINNIKKAADE